MTALWAMVGGVVTLLSALGFGWYMATQRGRAEERNDQARREKEADTKMLNSLANPSDKSDTVNKLRDGSF